MATHRRKRGKTGGRSAKAGAAHTRSHRHERAATDEPRSSAADPGLASPVIAGSSPDAEPVAVHPGRDIEHELDDDRGVER